MKPPTLEIKTMNGSTYNGISDHIYYDNGKAKTVCTTTVLGALGISPTTYHYSGFIPQIQGILRRNGYAVRSRASHTKAASTVGALRGIIAKNTTKWGDPSGTHYAVVVRCGNGGAHIILMNREGKTLVDTAPVKRDRRRILKVMAVFKKN